MGRNIMLDVSAAIIRDECGKILICQRGPGGNCAWLWEFPGGKKETYETPEECLIRECREELNIEICIKSLFAKTTYSYPDRTINFSFFYAHIQRGVPTMNVHHDMRWVQPTSLAEYVFCPADMEVIQKLAGA
jgi:8-oxo-dGTP diphosphatase